MDKYVHNDVVTESLVDELVAVAKQDPVTGPRVLPDQTRAAVRRSVEEERKLLRELASSRRSAAFAAFQKRTVNKSPPEISPKEAGHG
jgi:hypothetical protein